MIEMASHVQGESAQEGDPIHIYVKRNLKNI